MSLMSAFWQTTSLRETVRMKVILVFFLAVLLSGLAGCGAPDGGVGTIAALTTAEAAGLKLPAIRADAELDIGERAAGTLAALNETIQQINATVKAGLEIGPKTRATLETFRAEIEQFNETGVLGAAGVVEFQRLVTQLEEGLKFGLDDVTIGLMDDYRRDILEYPERWGEQGQDLVVALGFMGTDLADELAKDVEQLSTQVSNDINGIIQVLGVEARCTLGRAGEEIDDALEEAGGKFFAGALQAITGARKEQTAPPKLASICTILPREVKIVWQDGKQIADDESQILTVSGFNFSNADRPKVYVQSSDEVPVEGIELAATRESPFLLAISLQLIDFTDVITAGSSIALEWPNQGPDGKFAKLLVVDDAPEPKADFAVGTTNGQAPLTVKFYDASTGQPESWFWDFGDGQVLDGVREPEHKYECPGVYSVVLEVTNRYKREPDRKVLTDLISVDAPLPVAGFSGTPTSGTGSVEVTFTDQSEGATEWHWKFDNGVEGPRRVHIVKNGRGPHTVRFTEPGAYSATLQVKDNCGRESTHVETNYVTIASIPPAPDAKLRASAQRGMAPLTVEFEDKSTNGPTSWTWDFGDGSQNATTKNVSHVFSEPGEYTVTLSASHAHGNDTVQQMIHVLPPAKWETSTWITVGARKTHKNDTSEWCPTGYFLVQLDLDEARSGASDGQRPIVGQAKCARLSGNESTRWSPSQPRKLDISDDPVWCPNGFFLTSIDYDGCSSGRNCPKPVFAFCSQSPYFMEWQLLPWQEVEDSHSRDSDGWCEDGSFLVGLRHRGGGDRHKYSYPVISHARCAKPIID